MRTSAELREGFLSFFESKDHRRLPSWPLVPRPEDTSTLLTSAGMQPQMPYFLGREEPPAPLTTTAQKCFRTPDIDEVGLDGHHLTFFEMLGNFSFGQYFKQGAIELATEFIQDHLKLDWERVWATVHAGDPQLGLGEDEVAVGHWLEVGIPRERIVALPSSENFWSVGGPGPCGPDSEIYFDWGEEYGCGDPGCAPACPRCDRFLEFWNLVFMEYELKPDGTLTPLPQQNVDTGMGLERLAAIVQEVPSRSVYETDGYQAIMAWIEEESGVAWDADEVATKAHRVLADHGRGMTCLVADGVVPSNEGRGYVLRRIIRRAVQQARKIGLEDLWRLSDVVVEQMGQWYPELEANREPIREALRAEEERFSETLARGMKLFDEVAAKGDISAEDAFTLTATYGFPIELTEELARERGHAVDEDGFKRLMEEHREISRAGGEKSELQRAGDFAREAGFETEFVGWEKTEVLTQIGALEDLGDGTFLAKLRESPFYPDGGGQVSDQGWIEADGKRAELAAAFRFGEDQALVFRGRGVLRGRAGQGLRPLEGALPDDGQPHGDTPPAQGASGGPRRPRAPGRLGSAPRQAALRLHPPAGDERGGARARGGDRQRAGVREPPGAHVPDADRGGAEARRDDALRREVRRGRPRGRGPRLLARALRRHPRALDRRDRAVRDHLRRLRRIGRAAHRSRDLRRGLRVPSRAGGGGRRAAVGARAGAQGGKAEAGDERGAPRSSRRGETRPAGWR